MKLNIKHLICSAALLSLSHVSSVYANISGVMGPNIDPNDRNIQFRTAVSFADDASQEDAWAYRVHYQHAFSDTLRGRVEMQYRDRGTFEYDFFRTELLYNFKKRAQGEIWSSAFRFDLRTRRGSRAEEFAVNWSNEWTLPDNYRVRTTLILGQQIGGSRASNDLSVQTRGSVSRKLDNGMRIGLQMLNVHGELGNFGSIDTQRVYIGPSLSGSAGEFKYELRYLSGITDATPDNSLFFRITAKL